jgi:hypothetical protein
MNQSAAVAAGNVKGSALLSEPIDKILLYIVSANICQLAGKELQ